MSMQVIIGTGKLYGVDGQHIADITYELQEEPATEYTKERWRGEFTADHDIDTHGKYIIELEDGRKGTCFIKLDIQLVPGLPTVYRYSLQGSGILT